MQRLLSLALVFSVLASGASAQTADITTGAINGRVLDATGSAVPGVTVIVTNPETGLKRNVVTDADGLYATSLLPPGRYRVDAELAGLGKAAAPDVEVLLGRSTRVDLKLTTQVTEVVTVTATSPLVDASRTATTMAITQDQIQNLPLIGRDFRSLAQLTPGVVDSFGGRITANGARGVATDYNIDGASSNNDFFGENTGGTRAPFTFSQAAIKEFQVVRSQYDAEFGRGVGAQLNAITRSGTNEFSGEAFLFARRRDWAAERPLRFDNGQAVTDTFRSKDSTQPGFAVGGPIVKNKAFFFGNFDAQRQTLPVTAVDIRETDNFRNLSPAVQQQFLSKLENYIGHSYDLEPSYEQTFDQNTYLGKVDFNLGTNYRLSVRNNYTKFETANNFQANAQWSNQGVPNDKFNQLVGQLTMSLSPRMVNLVTVQHSYDQRPVNPVTPSDPEVSISGITSGAIFFGRNDGLPNNTKESKVQIKDTLQYALGRHNLKVGTDLMFMNIDNLFARYQAGLYAYSSPQAYVDENPNTFRQGYGPGAGLTTWSQNTYAFFVSDNFRLGPRLTLDMGLRYDWQTMPLPAENKYPQYPEFIDDFTVDRDNVAPRFGIAYDLAGDGRSVLRGGTGLFYGYMPDILLSNPLTQISGNFSDVLLTCSTATTVRCPTFPNLWTADQFNQLARTATSIVTVSRDYQAQQAWRSNVQYERQLPYHMSVGIGGIYSKLTDVQGSRNVNATKSGVMLGNVPHYDLMAANRKYPDLAVVRELCSCEEASFKALTLETHKLAVGGSRLSWDLSYTLSKAIDQDSNERSTSSSFLYDPNNPALSEGPGDNDVRHRVVADFTYRVVWGILASGIAQYRTGVPYTAGISFTGIGIPGNPSSLSGLSSTTGNIPVFLDGNGEMIDLTLANNTSRAQFAQFLADRDATIAGRNTYRQPSYWNFDLRLSKSFSLGGGTRLEVLGEVFNVANRQNRFVSGTNQNAFAATYTQATDRYTFTRTSTFELVNSYLNSSDPRQFQMAVKLFF